MRYIVFIFIFSLCISNSINSQDVNRVKIDNLQKNSRPNIIVPNIGDFTTLKGDFHMHTVFSDGNLWPTVRVQEAWVDGLDVIAITDHVEYRPFKNYVKGDLNSSYKIAKPEADKLGITLIHATEITRSMAPGHFNALFIEDANLIKTETAVQAIEAANKQGAFVFWNHPGWKAQQPDTTKWWDVHTELYNKGWLHGVEVFNNDEYYPIAIGWCVDKNLAPFANSDVHSIVSHKYDLDKYFRPMTLVFAKENSVEAIKEAMFAKRTVAWFGNYLAGDEKYLAEMFHNSVEYIKNPKSTKEKQFYTLKNNTDLTFELKNVNKTSQSVTILPRSVVTISFKSADKKRLTYKLTNCLIRMNEVLELNLEL